MARFSDEDEVGLCDFGRGADVIENEARTPDSSFEEGGVYCRGGEPMTEGIGCAIRDC